MCDYGSRDTQWRAISFRNKSDKAQLEGEERLVEGTELGLNVGFDPRVALTRFSQPSPIDVDTLQRPVAFT